MKKRLLRKLPDVNLQLYLVERLTSYLLWLFSELHHLFPLMKLANTNQNLFFQLTAMPALRTLPEHLL